MTYPATLAAMIVANPSGSFFDGGAWAIVTFGLATVLLIIWTYAGTRARWIWHVSALMVVIAGGVIAWGIDRPDVQLFVAYSLDAS